MSTVESDVIDLEEDENDHPRECQMSRLAPVRAPLTSRVHGVTTGTLIGFKDEGQTPLVLYEGQPGPKAVGAASIVDLYGTHIGRQVALMFEDGDLRRPMIIGVLRNRQGWPVAEQPVQVEIDADGERLIVSAKEQLVLRCGSASITLTKAGKVLIQGAYVSSRSSGVVRIKGGSVQIN
jgi:hypothetical protein